jgi:hypothetical protein
MKQAYSLQISEDLAIKSHTESIKFNPQHREPNYLKFYLILRSYLALSTSTSYFDYGFPTKRFVRSTSSMRTASPAHLMLLVVIILLTFSGFFMYHHV